MFIIVQFLVCVCVCVCICVCSDFSVHSSTGDTETCPWKRIWFSTRNFFCIQMTTVTVDTILCLLFFCKLFNICILTLLLHICGIIYNIYYCIVLYIILIHLVVCLTTGPKPLPKRAVHIVRSRASSFKWEYPLLSLRSSSSFVRLLPRLPFTSIPFYIYYIILYYIILYYIILYYM